MRRLGDFPTDEELKVMVAEVDQVGIKIGTTTGGGVRIEAYFHTLLHLQLASGPPLSGFDIFHPF